MTTPVVLSESRAVPADPARAFDELIGLPLPELFSRRYAALPPVRSVRDQQGAWGTPGQTRTIELADGGTMLEELLTVERPHEFRYRIGSITGALKPLVSAAEGRWAFEPVGTGVRITWEWRLTPSSRVAAVAMPVLGVMWHGYARQALEQAERLLLAG